MSVAVEIEMIKGLMAAGILTQAEARKMLLDTEDPIWLAFLEKCKEAIK